MHAYLMYSIVESDAHMVHELARVVEGTGLLVEYHYVHPDHPKGQHAYDEVARAQMFVGLITSNNDKGLVLQLFQYAKAQGTPATLLVEKGNVIPAAIKRDPDVMVFSRYMPANPIRYIEMWVSQR
ncbi:MAG: hypothetical protein AAGN35_25405 [Bacteroidota bacterium]